MRIALLTTTIICLSASAIWSQTIDLTVLEFEYYMDLVKANHPVAKQADLQLERGDAAVLSARGGFDPKAMGDLGQKYFDDKQYYSLIDGGLKVPTWFGLEFGAGYETNDGVFLNPQESVPNDGLWYAGVSVPIGQGLFIDQRRAQLRQAKIYRESTQAERQIILNELLLKAGKAYWDWYQAYQFELIFEAAEEAARQRYEAVKQSAVLGDRPDIDTLEASIQLQNRILSLQQAQLDERNARIQLSVYLWADGFVPLELAETAIPEIPQENIGIPVDSEFLIQMDSLVNAHPQLQLTQFKIDQLEVDRRWKAEQLKPELNLKYNALSEPINGDPLAEYAVNNYNWGMEFSMPLALRKERGALRLAKIKIEEADFDLYDKRAKLMFEARAVMNEWATTVDQINLYNRTVRDYSGLLQGERDLFDAGESSLFLVNRRELGYISAQLKMAELMAKNRKAALQTEFVFGILGQ